MSGNHSSSSIQNPERISSTQWRSLIAAMSGWTLDAMDWMMLALALSLIRTEFGISLGQAGLLVTATLAGAAIGGIFAGSLADSMGRVRVLTYTMLWYGIFTAACGFAQNFTQLLILRFVVGIGLGGEWGVGAALVSEHWPSRLRARATSLVHSGWPIGYGLAAIAYMLVAPQWGWRALFFVGIIPAFVALWIRRGVPEPQAWEQTQQERLATDPAERQNPFAILFSPEYRRRTMWACVLASGALMAYWGSATWLPSYLATGRGLDVVRSGWSSSS